MSKPERPEGVVMTEDEVARLRSRGVDVPRDWPEPGPPDLPPVPQGIRRWREATEGAGGMDVDLDKPPTVTVRPHLAGGFDVIVPEEETLKKAAAWLAFALRDGTRADLIQQRREALDAVLQRLDQIEVLRAQAVARGAR